MVAHASPASAQYWTVSDATDTMYVHVVLLSLSPWNLLNPLEGREQGNHRGGLDQFVHSAIVVFIHPSQTLTTIPEAVSFFQAQHGAIMQDCHSSGWCILCKLPTFEMSWFFPMIPKMPYLALPASMSTVDPSIQPMLWLDQAGCNADNLFIWLLHNMERHDAEYAIMPPALQSSMSMPWDLHMEDFPKLWQNSIYITWKQGFPSEDVGLAMTLVSTCHREFNTKRMVLDLSDEAIIKYLVLKVDDDEVDSNDDASMAGDSESEDDSSDSDDIDNDLQQMALDVANKTDDSGFWSGTDEHPKIKVLPGTGTHWTGMAPSYLLGAPAGSLSFFSSSHAATQSQKLTGASFDEYVQHAAGQFGSVGELMGGQVLLKDHTSPGEAAELHKLAEDQIEITRHFDAKFSKTAFALLQKTQMVFMGMGRIAMKFVNDMAMAGLNFIRDTTAYGAELSSSDAVAFAEGLMNIWLRIADLIKEVATLELMYEGAQKEFTSILE